MTDDIPATFTIGSFRIAQEHRIAAPPNVVFAFLAHRREPCWLSIFAGRGGEMRIDARSGGAVGEFWGDGNVFLWGTVNEVETDRVLAWTGPNGMQGAVFGTTRITLDPEADGASTVLRLVHSAFGDVGPDDERRYGEGGGWNILLGNLRRLAEAAAKD